MYLRTTTRKRGDKAYQSLHLVESYRTREGKVRQKIVVNFGSANRYSKEQVEEIIEALKKFFKLDEALDEPVLPAASQDFGSTYLIFRIIEELGWEQVFQRYLRGRKFDFDLIPNLKVLIANRLLDPMAKLHILDWMEGVYFPGVERGEIDYNHLLRTMDFVIEHKRDLEPRLASPMLTLFDNPLDLVFYDLTSCYFEIDQDDRDKKPSRKTPSTLRNHGYDRDHSGCPQIVLGLVMTRYGIPLCHYVFPGETPDKSTFKEVIGDLKERFPIKRCIVVADRGLLSEENLEVLSEVQLDYIVARPLRRNKISRKAIEATSPKFRSESKLWKEKETEASERESFHEVTLDNRRFVVAYSEEIATDTKESRTAKLASATSYIKWRIARTHGQIEGTIPVKGKALSYQETLLHVHDYLKERKLARFYRISLHESGKVHWGPDEENRSWESKIDGKLLLETTSKTLSPTEVVHQYKELQDIERCFRTLKSSLDIHPVHHWVDRRIRAHIFICVMALQIHRFIRTRLHKAKIFKSPERVLEKLSFQRTVEADVGGKKIRGIIPPTPEQLTLFNAIGVPAPKHMDSNN